MPAIFVSSADEQVHGAWHTLGRLRGVFVGEDQADFEQASLPERLLFAWDSAVPDLQIEDTLGVLLRPGVETEGVVLSPLLSVGRLALRSIARVTASILTSPPAGG